MWSSIDIKMNHTLVSTSGTDYMYKALIETLLNYNEGANVTYENIQGQKLN